jgi:hypothetical protein
MSSIGRLSEQQLQLLFLMQSMVLSFKPDGFTRLTDADVALATSALAASSRPRARAAKPLIVLP